MPAKESTRPDKSGTRKEQMLLLAKAYMSVFFRGRNDVFPYLYKGRDDKNYYQFECANIFSRKQCSKSRDYQGPKTSCSKMQTP